jgi:hypothetical protein
VAFGPKNMCGMALLDMSVKQGIQQIQYLMDHLFSRDPVGNLMLVALRSLQLESGSGLHLLENPGKWVPYLTPCWLTSVRQFLNSHKIKIKVASAKNVPLSKDNDHHIMNETCKLGFHNSLISMQFACTYK